MKPRKSLITVDVNGRGDSYHASKTKTIYICLFWTTIHSDMLAINLEGQAQMIVTEQK